MKRRDFMTLALVGGTGLMALTGMLGCTDEQLSKAGRDFRSAFGIDSRPPTPRGDDEGAPDMTLPADIRGTISQDAVLLATGNRPISGVGVCVGLVENGSREIPPRLRTGLVTYLKKRGFGSASAGTQNVVPSNVLMDPDSAIVILHSPVPPGAPKGTPLDVFVEVAPRTSTTDLRGGYLWPTELSIGGAATGGEVGSVSLTSLARAEGAVFVNPFVDATDPKKRVKLRRGRILGGAIVTEDMKIRLQLIRPSYSMARRIERLINERFPHPDSYGKYASAQSENLILLTIPPEYRKNYWYFLELVMHLPRRTGAGAYTQLAQRVGRDLEKSRVNHAGLALTWEAMGRSVLPIIQKRYTSKSTTARFYAARAGMRLGDMHLAGGVLLKFAKMSGPFQLIALKELGYHPKFLRGQVELKTQLDSTNELVRVTSYEALLRLGDYARVLRYAVDKSEIPGERPGFYADVVDSKGAFVVYATQCKQPQMVLFGKTIPVAESVFYSGDIGQTTIYGAKGKTPAEIAKMVAKAKEMAKITGRPAEVLTDRDKAILAKPHLVVYRKLPDGVRTTKHYYVRPQLLDLLQVLGGTPRPHFRTGDVPGLGLTYGQCVGIVYHFCKNKIVPAKFVLQDLPEIQSLYRNRPLGNETALPAVTDPAAKK